MELWEYADVLLRWAWVILLVTAVCAAAAVGLGKLQAPRYTSVVELTVAPARLDLGLSQTVTAMLRNYVSGIQSQSMALRVIDRLGLSGTDSRTLRSRIEAEADEAEYRVKIAVTDADPVLAQRVAQAAAELLVADVQEFSSRQDPLDRWTATVLNGGALAASRTWPRTKFLAFVGLGGGFLLGLFAALALEWARADLVRRPEEMEQWLDLPVLGSIPAARGLATASSRRPGWRTLLRRQGSGEPRA